MLSFLSLKTKNLSRNVLDISSVILDVRAENMQEVAQFVVAKAARGFDAEQQSKVKSGALCDSAVN